MEVVEAYEQKQCSKGQGDDTTREITNYKKYDIQQITVRKREDKMDNILEKNSCDELNYPQEGENTSESSDISSCVKNNWDDNIKKFQKYLLCIRTLLKLSPEQAGRLLGVSRQTVANLELGNTKMSTIQYVAIKSLYRLIYKQRELRSIHDLYSALNEKAKGGANNQLFINFSNLLEYFIEDYYSTPDPYPTNYWKLDSAIENFLSLDDIQGYVDSFNKEEQLLAIFNDFMKDSQAKLVFK